MHHNNGDYLFKLQPYTGPESRHQCPSCKRPNVFSRYIKTTTGEELGWHVGRCNREQNCGYHYTPGMLFKNDPKANQLWISFSDTGRQRSTSRVWTQPSFIDSRFLTTTLGHYEENNLLKYLTQILGRETVESLIIRFKIGTAKHWPGATVFWQIDKDENIRTGKVILYDSSTGHRVKSINPAIQWVHKLLNTHGFVLEQCLFGEHQLSTVPADKPVAIVESEKTAIIASVYMPEYIWMATGGINNLSPEKLRCLEGRKVVFWPDLGAYDKWAAKMNEIKGQVKCDLDISDVLEVNAPEEDRQNGLDIADYLVASVPNEACESSM